MVRELSRSPLVEIGAHTWASHYGLPANPQGSREPAAANRGWDKTTGRYESDAQFTRRMTDDVQKVTAKIHEVAGKTPRALVWLLRRRQRQHSPSPNSKGISWRLR